MKRYFVLFVSALLIFSLNACNLSNAGTPTGAGNDPVGTKVSMTLTALNQSTPLQTSLSSPTLEQPASTLPATLTPAFSPTFTFTPTIIGTLEATITPIPKPGTIAGGISGYPYGAIPSLAIVAFGQEPPYNYSYIITSPGDTSFSMSTSYLLPGKYQVVAYDSISRTGGCPGFVTVLSDQTVNCNISNWSGGYPAKPSGVPSP